MADASKRLLRCSPRDCLYCTAALISSEQAPSQRFVLYMALCWTPFSIIPHFILVGVLVCVMAHMLWCLCDPLCGIFDLFRVFLLKTCNRSSLWLSAMVQAWCDERFFPTLLWIKTVEFKYVILF